MKKYHFIAPITLCTCIEAENEAEARKMAVEEFNSGEFLCDLTIEDREVELDDIEPEEL